MRQEQVLRHWKILLKLEAHRVGMSPKQLAEEFRVSERTIYRDLLTLQDAGFPFTSEKIDGVTHYYLTEHPGLTSKLGFGPSELLALYLSQGILSQLRGTIFQEAIESLLEKVNAILPESAREYFRELEASIIIDLFTRRDYRKKSKEIQAILSSLRERTTLNFLYFSPARGELERELDPYCLWVMGDSLYLIGYCHINREIRTFLLDRIKKAASTKKRFKLKAGFDFRKYTEESFRVIRGDEKYEFELKFDPKVSFLIEERTWHPTQKLVKNPDGSITLKFKARGLEEVKSWALSFGELVEVIEPKPLREQIKSTCERIFKKYKGE